jgi:hypothetical protein
MRHLLAGALWLTLAPLSWAQAPAWDGRSPAPDPIETGSCALFLRVVEAGSDVALSSQVILWRRDAPATQHWAAGDQRHTIVEVEGQGTWIRDLPAGRYFAVVAEERHAAPHQEEIVVGGAETRARLPIQRPEARRIRVRVHDELGASLTSIRCSSRNSSSAGAPEFVTPPNYRPRECLVQPVFGFGAGAYGCSSSGSRTKLAYADGFFRIGKLGEDTRGVRRRATWFLDADARSRVVVAVDSARQGGLEHYLATVIRPERVVQRLVQPNGLRGAEAVTVDSLLLPWTPESPPDAWLDAPIRVRVDDPRYEPLEFTFCLRGGESPERRLEPRREE